LCRGVGWESDGKFELMSHCHCSICRKSHGSAFATYVATSEAAFRWTGGEELISRFESSPGFLRPFCSRCGSVVSGDPSDGRVFMPAGCLDDDPIARPGAHIFAASKAPWHEITDELKCFAEYPPGFGARVPAPERESPSQGAVRGSCVCNAVAYELSGELALIVNCHCSRCRKARAAAHGSNLLLSPGQFRWLRGDDQLEGYTLPDASNGYGTCFCPQCGSSMPKVVNNGAMAVPSGSLDSDPGARERIHIFVGSKAPWYEISDDLPQFEERPPGVG
jgi:hypothetical protein